MSRVIRREMASRATGVGETIERLAFGELAVLAVAERDQLAVEQVRPDDQLDEARVRAGG